MCFVYIGTCVPWIAIETNFFKLCIICRLDEHLLYAYACLLKRKRCKEKLKAKRTKMLYT